MLARGCIRDGQLLEPGDVNGGCDRLARLPPRCGPALTTSAASSVMMSPATQRVMGSFRILNSARCRTHEAGSREACEERCSLGPAAPSGPLAPTVQGQERGVPLDPGGGPADPGDQETRVRSVCIAETRRANETSTIDRPSRVRIPEAPDFDNHGSVLLEPASFVIPRRATAADAGNLDTVTISSRFYSTRGVRPHGARCYMVMNCAHDDENS
jgi:hypothetical protein